MLRIRTGVLLVALTTACTTSAASVVQAQPLWRVDLGLVTEFPLHVGAEAAVEGPHRLDLFQEMGVLPGPYLSAINGVLVGLEAYDDSTARIIEATLASSLVWRTHLGWRPWAHRGFYAEAGYGLVTLGGNLTSQELLLAVTGRAPAETRSGQPVAFSATATLHMIDLVAGWEWPMLRDHLVVRASVGFAGTVASTTALSPDFTPNRPMAVAQLVGAGEAYLDDIFTRYVFMPTFALGVSWRP